eukprot:2688324-Prymnesium_polylepis.1
MVCGLRVDAGPWRGGLGMRAKRAYLQATNSVAVGCVARSSPPREQQLRCVATGGCEVDFVICVAGGVQQCRSVGRPRPTY